MPVKVLSAPVLPPLVDPAVLAAAVRAGVRQPDINQAVYEVDTFLVALTVEDLSSGRPSVTFEPVTEGVPGQLIHGVREGSVYAALGLLDGDIIESINGVPLDGPGQALAGLGEGDRGVVVQVSRAGVSAARELRFVGGLAWSHVLAERTGAPLPAEAPAVIADPVFPDMPSAPAPGAIAEASAGGPRASGTSSRPGTTTTPNSTGKSARPEPSGASGPIQCGLDGICFVARRDFDAAVADPGKLLRQVSVSEVRGGYKLDGIRSGSQVSQLGFRDGDVVTSVNGVRLDDSLGLLGLYGGLATTSSYKVVYERGGVRRGKVVRLRE
jgi:S1-C subfamily serine protease